MTTLSELLKSSKQQQKYDAYIVFPGALTNSYNKKTYPSHSKILHLGRGSILKQTLVSCCHRAISEFNTNPLMVNWEILSIQEIKRDRRYKRRGQYCKRCLQIVGI